MWSEFETAKSVVLYFVDCTAAVPFDNLGQVNSNMNGLSVASAMLACMFVSIAGMGVSKYAVRLGQL